MKDAKVFIDGQYLGHVESVEESNEEDFKDVRVIEEKEYVLLTIHFEFELMRPMKNITPKKC